MTTTLSQQILQELQLSPHGLSPEDVETRRSTYGCNEIPVKRKSRLKAFFGQFQNMMVYILLGAVVLSFVVPLLVNGAVHSEEYIDAAAIFAIILINAVLGFVQESKAENAIALLKNLSAPQVRVRRSGHTQIIPAREIVPGDIMLIEAGDKISADGRIVTMSSLGVNESSLTGESLPVHKAPEAGPTPKDTARVFAGTVVTRGSAEVAVTATGLHTEIGKITAMVAATEPPPTPLQMELERVGARIGGIVLILCAAIFAAGMYQGTELVAMFMTVVSLAVAAVPEGLPAVVTVCLAIGVQRMIRRNALIRKLDAIETLGSVTVICSDKTGTITENRMQVTDAWTPSGADADVSLLTTAMASCNRAELPDIGDPTEIALLVYGKEKGLTRLSIDEEEVPFTSEEKYMVTRHTMEGNTVRFMKGAPEVVVARCSLAEKQEILGKNASMAESGLRVLAAAVDRGEGFTFLGLLGMLDPARSGVKEAVDIALRAGMRTIMITGDNPISARVIARNVGIHSAGALDGDALDTMDIPKLQEALKTVTVFARVRPEHKVKILEALQAQGEIVAMSGDGVNDAPALKRAHVGVAMGKQGTDVARESASMVLTDDNFSVIVAAVAEGRRIYDNIQRFILFLLRCNIGEVAIIATTVFLGLPLPLVPLQLLWLNLVTDSFPALALAAEKGGDDVMQRPPRPKGVHLLSGQIPLMAVAAVIGTVVVLYAFRVGDALVPGNDYLVGRSAALTACVLFQLLLSYSSRTVTPSFIPPIFANRWLLIACLSSAGIHLALLYSPVAHIFSLTGIPTPLWLHIIAASVVGYLLLELAKCIPWMKPRG